MASNLFELLDSLRDYGDWRRNRLKTLGAPSWLYELPSEREDCLQFMAEAEAESLLEDYSQLMAEADAERFLDGEEEAD